MFALHHDRVKSFPGVKVNPFCYYLLFNFVFNDTYPAGAGYISLGFYIGMEIKNKNKNDKTIRESKTLKKASKSLTSSASQRKIVQQNLFSMVFPFQQQ